MPIVLRGPRKAMRGKCERGHESANADGRVRKSFGGRPKAMRGKCERGHGSANADGAGAEVFAGDGYSQKAPFGPMAAISRRGQGGRIYNNTRARVLLRRMCVKPADLTTHSPPKTSARPRTATRPRRALPLPPRTLPLPRPATMHSSPPSQPIPRRSPSLAPAQRHALPEHFRPPRSPTHTRRLCDAFPADLTTHSPPKTFARPRTATRPPRALPPPTQPRRTPAGCAMHSPPTSQPIPAEDLRPPPHSNTPFPSTSDRPRNPDAHPQAARCTPADRTTHSPHSDTLPLLPFRFGHKKTAPHSACAMPNVSVDRRCGRSFGLVSRALFAAVAGRWRVGVGLRPQPWALRSRRCGRVLRA